MTVDELKAYYGVEKDYELALKLGRQKAAISKWRSNGVPPQVQALIESFINEQPKPQGKTNDAIIATN